MIYTGIRQTPEMIAQTALQEIGERAVFGPGSPTTDTIAFLKTLEAERATSDA